MNMEPSLNNPTTTTTRIRVLQVDFMEKRIFLFLNYMSFLICTYKSQNTLSQLALFFRLVLFQVLLYPQIGLKRQKEDRQKRTPYIR